MRLEKALEAAMQTYKIWLSEKKIDNSDMDDNVMIT